MTLLMALLLQAELPALAVEWTSPDEATIEKTKAAFRRKK